MTDKYSSLQRQRCIRSCIKCSMKKEQETKNKAYILIIKGDKNYE